MLGKPKRLLLPEAMLLLCLAAILVRLYQAAQGEQITQAGARQGRYHLHLPLSAGVIYDRNLQPLNQTEHVWYAVVNPTPEASAVLVGKADDKEAFSAGFQSRKPFLCRLKEPVQNSRDLVVLEETENRPGALPAQHLLGYVQNGKAVSGSFH